MMEWVRSKQVLANMRDVLQCNICTQTLVDPVTYGQCSHLFCRHCIDNHPGGICPVAGCQATAEIKAIKQHKTIDSLTKSIAKISQLFGDEIPDRMIRHLSCDEEVLQNDPKPPAKKDINEKLVVEDKRSLSKEAKSGRKRQSGRQVLNLIDNDISIKESKKSGPQKVTQSKITAKNDVKMKATKTFVEKRNKKGETQLHQATLKGDTAAVTKLLQQGSNPNTVDNAGWCPLHEAVAEGYIPIVTLLLQHGASPNMHSKDEKETPLHDAVANRHLDMVKLLVSYGADIRAKSCTGKTPLDVSQWEDITDALLNTECLMTENKAIDNSVIQDNFNSMDNVVLACPESSDSDFKRISSCATSVGMKKPSKAINENTTHCLLVTGKQVNMMSCLVAGVVILQQEWIFQCKQLGSIVDTEPFLFQHPDLLDDGRMRSLDCRSRGQPRLLAGLHFYMTGGFDSQVISKAELVKLINLAGGRSINREPDAENLPEAERTVAHHADADTSLVSTSHVILYQQGNKREPQMKYKMPHIKTLPVLWLRQSIFSHALLSPELYVP